MRAIHEGVLFRFLDEYEANGFNNYTDSGIIFKSYDHDAKTHRWAKVISVGPEVKYVKEGDEILIENLRWTEGVNVDGTKIWCTIEREVMLVRNQDA